MRSLSILLGLGSLPAAVFAAEINERFPSYLQPRAHRLNWNVRSGRNRETLTTLGGKELPKVSGIWYLVAPDPETGGPIRLVTEETVENVASYIRSRPQSSSAGRNVNINLSPAFCPGVPNDVLQDRLRWWFCGPVSSTTCVISYQKPREWIYDGVRITDEEFAHAEKNTRGLIPGRIGGTGMKTIWKLDNHTHTAPVLQMFEDAQMKTQGTEGRKPALALLPEDMVRMMNRFKNKDKIAVLEQAVRMKLTVRANVWHVDWYMDGSAGFYACPHDSSYFLTIARPSDENAPHLQDCVKLESLSFAYKAEKPRNRTPLPTEEELAEWGSRRRMRGGYMGWKQGRRERWVSGLPIMHEEDETKEQMNVEEDVKEKEKGAEELVKVEEVPTEDHAIEAFGGDKYPEDRLREPSEQGGDRDATHVISPLFVPRKSRPGLQIPERPSEDKWDRLQHEFDLSPEVPEPRHLRDSLDTEEASATKAKKFKSLEGDLNTNMLSPEVPEPRHLREHAQHERQEPEVANEVEPHGVVNPLALSPSSPERRKPKRGRPRHKSKNTWTGKEDLEAIKRRLKAHMRRVPLELPMYIAPRDNSLIVETTPHDFYSSANFDNFAPVDIQIPPLHDQEDIELVEEVLDIPPLQDEFEGDLYDRDMEDVDPYGLQAGVMHVVNTAMRSMDLTHLTPEVGARLVSIARGLRIAQARVQEALTGLLHPNGEGGSDERGQMDDERR